MHPTIDQIWYCKGVPRPNVFNRWRRELWEQVGPRLEALERENEALRAELETFRGVSSGQGQGWSSGPDLEPGAVVQELDGRHLVVGPAVPAKRGPGRPRKYPLPTEATA